MDEPNFEKLQQNYPAKESSKAPKVRTYCIDDSLNEILNYQLLKHKLNRLYPFCLPDPTITELGDAEYLVLTVLSLNQMPSVCFYKIEEISNKQQVN